MKREAAALTVTADEPSLRSIWSMTARLVVLREAAKVVAFLSWGWVSEHGRSGEGRSCW